MIDSKIPTDPSVWTPRHATRAMTACERAWLRLVDSTEADHITRLHEFYDAHELAGRVCRVTGVDFVFNVPSAVVNGQDVMVTTAGARLAVAWPHVVDHRITTVLAYALQLLGHAVELTWEVLAPLVGAFKADETAPAVPFTRYQFSLLQIALERFDPRHHAY